MQHRSFGLALFGLLILVGSARGQTPNQAPAPAIRQFDLATIEKLGREIYRQDTAAWVATDALRAKISDFAKEGLRGWIVEDEGDHQIVRFLRDVGQGLEGGFDVQVDAARQTSVSVPADRSLTDDERSAFRARETARRDLPGVCRPGYNSVVARDPNGEGWLVWWLAPTPQVGSIPFGGHYRFSISKDGTTVISRDALSASCLVMAAPTLPPGSKPVAVFVTHVVSSTPVETHVFLQLQSGQAVIVGAGGRMWAIEGGRIRDVGPIPASPKP